MIHNRRLGNTYTASVYMGLLSLLENAELRAGERIGIFSYGSGAVAEFFAGTLVEGYREHVRPSALTAQLDARREIGYEEYRERHIRADRTGDYETRAEGKGPFRLAGVRESVRVYEKA